MKKKNKRSKIIAFLIMISLILLWLSLLYVFYGIKTPTGQRTFALLLLVSPVIIIMMDKPTIFMDFANAWLDTISVLLMKIFEWIDRYIKERKVPKYKRRLMRKE